MTLTLSKLPQRRRQVAELVGDILPYREIAARLDISPHTVRSTVNEVARLLPEDGRDAYHRVLAWVLEQRKVA